MSDAEDSARLFEQVYDTLRSLSERHFRAQSSSITLQPTALVHEVYLRLARGDDQQFRDREHFLAVATRAMRQILVDHARRRNAIKRGGELARITLTDVAAIHADASGSGALGPALDLLEVDRLLDRLAELSPRQAQVVEMRIFAGMTVIEIATALEVSRATVEKDWRQARAWMRVEFQRGQEP